MAHPLRAMKRRSETVDRFTREVMFFTFVTEHMLVILVSICHHETANVY
jgi:hypothetical protein